MEAPQKLFMQILHYQKNRYFKSMGKAEYLSIDNNRPLVRYTVDGTNTKKCGYVLWKGGAK